MLLLYRRPHLALELLNDALLLVDIGRLDSDTLSNLIDLEGGVR